MFLSLDFANVLLFCAQQLGVALGVGAQTVLLVAYSQSMRDGVIDAKEAQFARAVRGVLNVGLLCIVLSGIGIGALEIFQGDASVVMQPAYLFKWALILFILLINVFADVVPQHMLESLRGGTWYALFVVHILAPITSWINLLTLYVLWMAGFALVWISLSYILQGKKIAAPAAAPRAEPKTELPNTDKSTVETKPETSSEQKPAAAAVPIIQPLELPPSFVPAPEPPAPPSTAASIAQTMADPGLPAIRVMPRSPTEIEHQ